MWRRGNLGHRIEPGMPGRYGGNLVVDDPTEAMRLVAAGEPVVLVVPSPPVCVTAGPGRLAIFVGSPEEPDTWAKAKAMGEEVFADWKSAVAPRPGTPTPTGRSEGPPELREAWKRSGT